MGDPAQARRKGVKLRAGPADERDMRSSATRRPARSALLVLAALAALAGPGAGCRSAPRESDPAALARVYREAGRLDEAARELELAVRQRPQDPALRVRAAEVLAEAGDVERAIGHLEVALRAAPGDPEISIRLGELERRRENVPDAYVAFRRAAELAPQDLRAVSGLALAAEALGFREEADRAYARWAEIERREGVRP